MTALERFNDWIERSFILTMYSDSINLGYVENCYTFQQNNIAGGLAGFRNSYLRAFLLASVLYGVETGLTETRPNPVFMETGVERADTLNWLGLGKYSQSAYRRRGNARCESVVGTLYPLFSPYEPNVY